MLKLKLLTGYPGLWKEIASVFEQFNDILLARRHLYNNLRSILVCFCSCFGEELIFSKFVSSVKWQTELYFNALCKSFIIAIVAIMFWQVMCMLVYFAIIALQKLASMNKKQMSGLLEIIFNRFRTQISL